MFAQLHVFILQWLRTVHTCREKNPRFVTAEALHSVCVFGGMEAIAARQESRQSWMLAYWGVLLWGLIGLGSPSADGGIMANNRLECVGTSKFAYCDEASCQLQLFTGRQLPGAFHTA